MPRDRSPQFFLTPLRAQCESFGASVRRSVADSTPAFKRFIGLRNLFLIAVFRLGAKQKGQRGQPPKSAPRVSVAFKMQQEEADYLLAVAKRFGWGIGINEVVRNIVVGEMIALQKAKFHSRKLPQDD